MERIPYIKPYLPLHQQVELLRARGMNVSDVERAVNCLQRIGYYRSNWRRGSVAIGHRQYRCRAGTMVGYTIYLFRCRALVVPAKMIWL